jgi:protein ImuB
MWKVIAMFACLYLPPPVNRSGGSGKSGKSGGATQPTYPTHPTYLTQLVQLARDFSPRVEAHGDRIVTLDISGLGSLLGDARAIGDALRRTAADRGLRVQIAMATTCTTAILLAQSRAGVTVIPPGEEARVLAPLPLAVLEGMRSGGSGRSGKTDQTHPTHLTQFRRWGLRTLGDLAAIPSADLSARLGQGGLLWQRWARGEDARPLVPAGEEERFEESLDLEWPIEGLEPLSFVLARLCDPLCERLERGDRGAVALHVTLTLVTRDVHERSLQLPAPMRDARVLRTLALLDLESHPPRAAIDRVTVGVEVTEGRVLQFGLFARALPTERLAPLMARLGALMGTDRVGAPALVDSYRPGAFAMAKFEPSADAKSKPIPDPRSLIPMSILRRFRSPIPARVTLAQGRPVRVVTDARIFSGGTVERCDGPWRSSGDWWVTGPGRSGKSDGADRAKRVDRAGQQAFTYRAHLPYPAHQPWNVDEWDVTLSDGASYRISQACEQPSAWFVNGVLD